MVWARNAVDRVANHLYGGLGLTPPRGRQAYVSGARPLRGLGS